MNCYQFDVGIQFPFQFNWNETNSKHFAVKRKNKQYIFNSKPAATLNAKNVFKVHGKISSKMRGDQDSMSEKIIFRTPEVPRRRRVELCDPGGDILFSGHENIGDHFISPGVLRRPKSAMDFSERPQNHAAAGTSEGYRWELLRQFVFCVSILREGGKTQEIAHSLILSRWILLSFILKLWKTFSISEWS